jgi:hypothetical protein
MSTRTTLNSAEIDHLVALLVEGNSWSDTKTKFLAINSLVSAVSDSYQTFCEQKARLYVTEHPAGAEAQYATLAALQVPALASSFPASGPARGGTVLTITGTGLGNVNSVTVGGHACTGVVATPTEVKAVTPTHAAEASLDIVVSDGTLTDTLSAAYEFTTNGTPTVASWSPKKLQAKGDRMHIMGSNFAGVTTVTIGGHACTIKLKSDSRLDVLTPAHAVAADLALVVSDGVLSDTENAAVDIVASTTPLLV